MQICGIKACTNKMDAFISRLGFILGSNPTTHMAEHVPSGTWRPKFCVPIAYGNTGARTDHTFPSIQQINDLNGPPKLKAIRSCALNGNEQVEGLQFIWEEFRSPYWKTRKYLGY